MSGAGGRELLDLAKSVVHRARDGEEVEAYAVRSVETDISVLDGELESLSSAESRGVGVRVVADHRQGYAYTAVVTEEGLAAALAEARSNAEVATPDEANGLPDPEPPADAGDLVDPDLATTPVERRIDLALELEAAARAADPRVRGVDLCRYADVRSEIALASTKGLALEGARTDAWAMIYALASEGDETQTGLGVAVGRGPGSLDVQVAGRDAAYRAARLLGASKPPSRRAAVVFDPQVTASFLGVLAEALSAEAVLKGRSMFADRIGDAVAAAHLSLLDDGLYPGAPGTAPWDGEGVPQRATGLIEDGTLSSYLHNTWTARRTGLGAHSTGNASRAGFKSSPGVAPSNLYLRPGGLDAEQVLAQVADGAYVQDVMGLHSGANPISGDFSVSFRGLAVRDGELAEPIREAAVSSTIVDVLRSIEVVGADLRFFPFGGALGGSTVLVSEMSVSGA